MEKPIKLTTMEIAQVGSLTLTIELAKEKEETAMHGNLVMNHQDIGPISSRELKMNKV